MRIISAFLFAALTLSANAYYSKLEPINSYIIKSAVSGKVVYANTDIEGKSPTKSTTIIKIDSTVDEIDLKATTAKLSITKKITDIERKNFKKLSSISTKSDFEKDTQKVKVLNLESSQEDLKIKIATLKDRLANKVLKEDSMFIYKVNVKEGDYVNPGSVLYEVKDLSSAKLEIFVAIDEVDSLKQKKIYLDGKVSKYTINKIFKVADAQHISSYRCEIVIDKPEKFSKLVKIEFR